MARRLKYIILIALVLCVGVGAAFFFLRGQLLSHPELILEEVAKQADLSLKDIDYSHISDGRKQWTLTASQAEYVQEKDVYSLKDVKVTYFRADGSTVSLRGNEGSFNRKEGWVKVSGKARITADGGYVMASETFTYRLEEQLLTTPDRVDFSGPGFKISGRGLKVEMKTVKATLMSDVSTTFDSKAGDAGV